MLSFLRQFERYGSAVSWLMGRVWRYSKVQFLLVLFGQWFGLAISALAILLLLTLVRTLEGEQEQVVFGAVVLPLDNEIYMACAVVFILFLMALGVVFLYRSRRGAVMLAGRFNLACAAEIASGYGVLGTSTAAYTSEIRLFREIARLMGSDARNAGMALRRLIDAELASLVLLVGGVLLFYLHWIATLAVVLVALSVSPFYYLINQKAARATRRFEDMSALGRADCLLALRKQAEVSSWQAPRVPSDGAGYPAFQALVEAHRDRFVAVTQSELTSRLLMVFALCILAFGLSYFSTEEETPWFLVLSYLIVLRFVMLAIRQINQAFTSISRFYPSLYRLSKYFSAVDHQGQPIDLERMAFTGRRRALMEQRKIIQLRVGRPVLVFLPEKLSCLNVELIAMALGMRAPGQQRSFYDSTVLVVGQPLEDSLHVADAAYKSRVAELAGLSNDLLMGDLEGAQVSAGSSGIRSSECRARIVLAEALLSEKALVLVNLDAPGMARAFVSMRELFDARYVLLCSETKITLPQKLSISTAVVIGADGTVVAGGSTHWMQMNWECVSALKQNIEKRLLATRVVKGQGEMFEEE